ncbi:chloride channel protein CLC-f [Cucumis sativus]|uniref:Chloride channel protein n=1 Tax=Cucumis sativus TaxID=3659 RepID=A0A0A0L4N0_CUCSA|nr:chloride channel protein CLC-f [Cucumis sativus]KGN55984.1 hypothetical protein Csa_010834 [Cucumis sativus]
MAEEEFSDQNRLLRSMEDHNEEDHDLESQDANGVHPLRNNSGKRGGFLDLLHHLNRGSSFSGRRLSYKRLDMDNHNVNFNPSSVNIVGRSRTASSSSSDRHNNFNSYSLHSPTAIDGEIDDNGDDTAPPEWALLLIACLLGLATGLCVAAFNIGVHVIHEWAWAGTPNEGAAWLRLQRMADTWHRILLIPVCGGVIVGMMHGLLEILSQIKQSSASQGQGFDLLSGVFPTVKAIQAAITLGTGCSLGPEGPSVDIGKSCANGFYLMMENNSEKIKIAFVAAGAAAGIASGFNAAVAGSFFAIETVLRPLRAENSPPFTTAMIILASVISSTVSNVLLGTQSAFTVPTYDLKSAAELPLYLILGMLCGAVSVAVTRLVAWFGNSFEFIKERFGLPPVVCPALGGLGAGIIALKYPGILYWGFTNVEEILHTGNRPSAPGIWLLTQIAAAKVVATALCKGSGLVGGLYAPSLMIGAAVGAVFGGSAVEIINIAIPGNAAVAQPQAYALVGMAATLASVCSVPLTSVLLLFELTKDYRILLPLMGAVGLAIWVPSVTKQTKENESSDKRGLARGYTSLSPSERKDGASWRYDNGGIDLELSEVVSSSGHESNYEESILEDLKVSQAMSKNYLKVSLSTYLKDALKYMKDNQQNCALVVDDDDFLEGILTHGDIKRYLFKKYGDAFMGDSLSVDTCLVSSIYTRGIRYRGRERGILTCYPDTALATAKELMEAKGIKQLPVVMRGKEKKRRIVAILYYNSLISCLREFVNQKETVYPSGKEIVVQENVADGH